MAILRKYLVCLVKKMCYNHVDARRRSGHGHVEKSMLTGLGWVKGVRCKYCTCLKYIDYKLTNDVMDA